MVKTLIGDNFNARLVLPRPIHGLGQLRAMKFGPELFPEHVRSEKLKAVDSV